MWDSRFLFFPFSFLFLQTSTDVAARSLSTSAPQCLTAWPQTTNRKPTRENSPFLNPDPLPLDASWWCSAFGTSLAERATYIFRHRCCTPPLGLGESLKSWPLTAPLPRLSSWIFKIVTFSPGWLESGSAGCVTFQNWGGIHGMRPCRISVSAGRSTRTTLSPCWSSSSSSMNRSYWLTLCCWWRTQSSRVTRWSWPRVAPISGECASRGWNNSRCALLLLTASGCLWL